MGVDFNLSFLRPLSWLPGRLIQEFHASSCLYSSVEQMNRTACRTFSTTPPISAIAKKPRPRYQDPYALAQAKARRNANLTRQETLRAQRATAQGDPIRGIPTPFVASFDTIALTPIETALDKLPTPDTPSLHLNHFFNPDELDTALSTSHALTAPAPTLDRSLADPGAEKLAARQHAEQHEVASVAVSRILSLANASSKSRTRANIQRCIDTFGRHNTDLTVRQKAPSATQVTATGSSDQRQLTATTRAGKDTGSSEVQIAILTAKIHVLADAFEGHAWKDKVNKRNLRLLLHRRQKLLRYFKQKERGSGRWEFLLETLGLTEATWEGQIAVEGGRGSPGN